MKHLKLALCGVVLIIGSSLAHAADLKAGKVTWEKLNCASCHGADAKSPIMPAYPILAGQHADYAVAQLTAFRDGVRKNNLQMSQVAAKLNDREIKALADYIAGLN
jgi:cytochrome c553